MADDTWTALADFATDEVVTATKLNEQLRDNLNVLQLGLSGDGSTQSEGIHAHKAGALADRPTPAKAGRWYYATDIGIWLMDDGTEWLINTDGGFAQKGEGWFDDLIVDYSIHWGSRADGSSSLDMLSGTESAVRMSTGATTGSRCLLRATTGAASRNFIDPTNITLAFFRLRTDDPSASNQSLLAGIVSGWDVTGDPVDGAYFLQAAANWFAVLRVGGVNQDSVDLGDDGASYINLILERTATQWKFYLNTFNAAGLKLTSSSSPTVDCDWGFRIGNNGTVDRRMSVDAGGIWKERP